MMAKKCVSLWEQLETGLVKSTEDVDDPSEGEEDEDEDEVMVVDSEEEIEDDDDEEFEDSVDLEVKCGVCGDSFRSVAR